ncbi:MAG: hypothetical protein O2985_01760, partial [Proteobacteria bacterium]|nr:hypothetical protein [Pseudomonadota bacterium]
MDVLTNALVTIRASAGGGLLVGRGRCFVARGLGFAGIFGRLIRLNRLIRRFRPFARGFSCVLACIIGRRDRVLGFFGPRTGSAGGFVGLGGFATIVEFSDARWLAVIGSP